MAESSTGDLWYALQTGTPGARIAKADPRNPPIGLPPFPQGGSGSQPSGTTKKLRPRLQLTLRRLKNGRRLSLRASVVRGAKGRLSVRVRRGRKSLTRRSTRSALAFKLKARGRVRVIASFQGRGRWRSRTLPTRTIRMRARPRR